MGSTADAMDEREKLSTRAFLQPRMRIGHLELRPLSAGSRALGQDLGLQMLSPNAESMSDSQGRIECAVMIWIHSQPLQAVLAAAERARDNFAGFVAEVIEPFMFELPPDAFERYIAALERDIELLKAADTEFVPRASAPGKENPPPNS